MTKDANGSFIVNLLFWLAVTVGQEIPIANKVSAWSGASTAENTALAAGQVIEEAHSVSFPSTITKAAAETELANEFTARQTQITNQLNPNLFFGVFLDSITGWSS